MPILKRIEEIEAPMAPHDAIHATMTSTLTPMTPPGMLDAAEMLRLGTDVGVAMATCAILLLLRLASYSFVKRCIIRLPSDAAFRDEASDRFMQIIAETLIMMAANICFLVMGLLCFTDDVFVAHPFTGWTDYLEVTFSVFLGHLICSLIVTSSSFPLCRSSCSGMTVNLIIAIICYSVILCSKINPLLAAMGMVLQYPTVHAQIYKMTSVMPSSPAHRTNLRIWVISLFLCGLLAPILMVVLECSFHQPIIDLKALYFSIFCIIVSFYAVATLLQLRIVVGELRGGDSYDYQELASNASEDDGLVATEKITYADYGILKPHVAYDIQRADNV